MKRSIRITQISVVILIAITVFFACQSLLEPPAEYTLDVDAAIPQQIARGHNEFLAKLFEKEAEWKGLGKADMLKTPEGRQQLLREAGMEYLRENPKYAGVDIEKSLATTQQLFQRLEERNNELLSKKAAVAENQAGSSDSADAPKITGQEFVENIMAIKVESGMMSERVHTAILELMHYQQTAGMTISTRDLQDYAEKEILSSEWTEEEKRQLAIALAVHRASSDTWAMKKLTDAEMAKVSTAENTQSWCDYLTMWADAGGAMIAGGATLPFIGANIGFAAVAGGYSSYLYRTYICS